MVSLIYVCVGETDGKHIPTIRVRIRYKMHERQCIPLLDTATDGTLHTNTGTCGP